MADNTNKVTILVIDDEKDFVELLEVRLKFEGYDVISASDGEEGLEKAENFKPDLVICDVKMPKKDGFDVLKQLRCKISAKTPFIMLTASDDFDKVKKAYEDKADFFITKTVDFAKLLSAIKTLLNISKKKI